MAGGTQNLFIVFTESLHDTPHTCRPHPKTLQSFGHKDRLSSVAASPINLGQKQVLTGRRVSPAHYYDPRQTLNGFIHLFHPVFTCYSASVIYVCTLTCDALFYPHEHPPSLILRAFVRTIMVYVDIFTFILQLNVMRLYLCCYIFTENKHMILY